MKRKRPDLSMLDGVVSPSVLEAMRVASARLSALRVRHALVGGLAVGFYGFPRATKDVDFLVGDEAFEQHEGGVVTMKPGVPIQVAGVLVDFLSAQPEELWISSTLDDSAGSNVIPIAPPAVLFYLKLRSPRAKDRADLVELVKAGVDVASVRSELERHAPELIPDLDACIASAQREED